MGEWEINFSEESEKFLNKNHLSNESIVDLIEKAGYKIVGEDVNIEIKKLSGKLQGFYRIKSGKLRIIFAINFDAKNIFIEYIEWRGRAYKNK